MVSAASAILSQPRDIALDSSGNLYVLDGLLAQIVVLSPSGERLNIIGREGSGPREFKRPRTLHLTGDTLRVGDIGNSRLQTLALHSDFVRSSPLPVGASIGEVAVNDAGWLLAPTLGIGGVLVSYHDAAGNQVATLGSPPAPPSTVMSFTSMKREILAGKVPAMYRNAVLPVFAPDGDIWLILTGEGAVQRYDSQGALEMSAPLVTPEMERIWARVMELTRAVMNDQRRMVGLAYVSSAAAVGDTLWVLLNMPEEEPAVMLAIGADGTVTRRVLFSAVRGALYFALDRSRGRIFFSIPSNASVVAAPWPDDGRLGRSGVPN